MKRGSGKTLRNGLVQGLVMVLLASSFAVAESAGSLPAEKLQEYKGSIVVLNFWATWCKPCRAEMPLLMELQREFEGRGVQFVGASTDKAEHRARAEEFLRKHAITYPVWFGLSDAEMKPLGLGSLLPATALFDREGNRVFRLIGELKRNTLVERLEWLLGRREQQPPKELLLPAGLSSSDYKD